MSWKFQSSIRMIVDDGDHVYIVQDEFLLYQFYSPDADFDT